MTIGVWTCGGDAPGMNAAIKGVWNYARSIGYDHLLAIHDAGLGVTGETILSSTLRPIFFQGLELESGSAIGSNKDVKEGGLTPEQLANAKRNIQYLVDHSGLEALVIIGGNGSVEFINQLSQNGCLPIPVVFIPKTIDNDFQLIEGPAMGFMSAVANNEQHFQKINNTGNSMRMIHVEKVMGQKCGALTLESAVRGGVDIALMPEFDYNPQTIVAAVRYLQQTEQRHVIIAVSETINDANGNSLALGTGQGICIKTGETDKYIADLLKDNGIRNVRPTPIGHEQRGAFIVLHDKDMGLSTGYYAAKAAFEQKGQNIFTPQVVMYGQDPNNLQLRKISDFIDARRAPLTLEYAKKRANGQFIFGCETPEEAVRILSNRGPRGIRPGAERIIQPAMVA